MVEIIKRTNKELACCPFCGGKSYIQVSKYSGQEFFCVFHECGLFGEMTSVPFPTEQDAVKAWNFES